MSKAAAPPREFQDAGHPDDVISVDADQVAAWRPAQIFDGTTVVLRSGVMLRLCISFRDFHAWVIAPHTWTPA